MQDLKLLLPRQLGAGLAAPQVANVRRLVLQLGGLAEMQEVLEGGEVHQQQERPPKAVPGMLPVLPRQRCHLWCRSLQQPQHPQAVLVHARDLLRCHETLQKLAAHPSQRRQLRPLMPRSQLAVQEARDGARSKIQRLGMAPRQCPGLLRRPVEAK